MADGRWLMVDGWLEVEGWRGRGEAPGTLEVDHGLLMFCYRRLAIGDWRLLIVGLKLAIVSRRLLI